MKNSTVIYAKQKLLAQLALSGAMSLDQFLNLWAGYYYSYNNPFGQKHFTTAPEISQMFGEVIGVFLVDKILNSNINKFNLLELGAGSGQLMQDVLRIMQKFNVLNRVENIFILENSNLLQKVQKDNLKQYNIEWLSNLKNLPELPTLVIANEFFDALPIKQFIKKDTGFHEIYVRESNGSIEFFPIDDAVNIGEINCEYESVIEYSPSANAIFSDLVNHIKNFKGLGVFIDYGYTKPLLRSTLRCYKGGEQVSIFSHAAESDITADVNFADFIKILDKKKVQNNITTQEKFLKNNGILVLAQKLIANGASPDKIENDLNKLIAKNEMGEKFKFLIAENLC